MAIINGNNTSEIINGTNDADLILARDGDDQVFGEDGDDILDGGAGNDELGGGTGNDLIRGQAGQDQIFGEEGDDILLAGADGDIVEGGEGNDFIEGDTGEDILSGGAGHDIIDAGADSDLVAGGDGDDILLGGDGHDVIEGGAGADFIQGDGGNDRFVYVDATDSDFTAMDVIAGFEQGNDQFDMTDLSFAGRRIDWGDTTPAGGGLWYAHEDGDTLIYADTDGDAGTAELAIRVVGEHDLTVDDFIGLNQLPTISGTDTGAVTEDDDPATLASGGDLDMVDPDPGEDGFVAQTGTSGLLGEFSIGADGAWTYTADNTSTAIQSLGEGIEVEETFTVETLDGTEHAVTVTVTGVNDEAVIGGNDAASLDEDDDTDGDGFLEAGGMLTVTDVDAGEDSFAALTDVAGTYGTFSIDAEGNWTYAAENDGAALQSLAAGEAATDDFVVESADGTQHTVVVTITGVNDESTVTGDFEGAVTEDDDSDGDDLLETAGTLVVEDIDTAEAHFVAQAGQAGFYGLFSIDADGAWTYAADNTLDEIQSLGAEDTIEDTFTVSTIDGNTQTVTITITGVNDDAQVGGDAAGSITEDDDSDGDGHLVDEGALEVNDPDQGESSFVAQSSVDGSYGVFSINADGIWTYEAHNDDVAIQSLGEGIEVTDEFAVTTADGTEAQVTITITGVNDLAVIEGDAAGEVTEDNDVEGVLAASGTLMVSDVDAGEAAFDPVTGIAGTYGLFSIDAEGHWTWHADNDEALIQSLGEGVTTIDTFEVSTIDGSLQAVTITITGVNDEAVIDGDRTGAVTEDDDSDGNGLLEASGALAVSDIDSGESVFVERTNAAGVYGLFSIDAEGNWTWSVDNESLAIQSLVDGETVTDTFDVQTADATMESVVITITGVNDAADIGGEDTGAVTEDVDPDGNGLLETAGALTIFDVDTAEDHFNSTGAIGGAYGTLTIDEEGNWTWAAVNDQPLIQSLREDEVVTDDYEVVSHDGTTHTITISITGVNDEAVIGGEAAGGVTEDDDPDSDGLLEAAGALTVEDADLGEADFVEQTAVEGAYGHFSIDIDGVWTWEADNTRASIQALRDGETVTDEFTVQTIDGTPQTVVVTITGVNDDPVIGGVDTGTVTEDDDPDLNDRIETSGVLTVADDDAEESAFVEQAGVDTMHGEFSIDADGNWTYQATNSQAAVQSLGEDDELFDEIFVQTVDGTSHAVTITIVGVNDAAAISGTDTGTLIEDHDLNGNGILEAAGHLDVDDVDSGESQFIAMSGETGTYGTFSIDEDGDWFYGAPRDGDAVQALGAGDEGTDAFTVETIDGTTHTVTITIAGVNDAAAITGDDTAALTEDVDPDTDSTLEAAGTLAVTDVDEGESEFVPQTAVAGTYGAFSIDTAGAWAYSAANGSTAIQALGAGDDVTDTFNVQSEDGTTKSVTITITGANDVAVIGGDDEGEVTEDAGTTLTDSGQLTIADVDTGESAFNVATVAGTYGSLSLEADGAWTYSASNAQAAIQILDDGDTLTDAIVVTSADGTEHTVTITIHGLDETNHAPTDIHLSMTHTPGGSTLPNGSSTAVTLGTLSSSDPESGDAHTYTLEPTSTSGFDISGNALRATSALQAGQTYTLQVTSTDSGTPTLAHTETITILTGTIGVDNAIATTAGDDVVYGLDGADVISGGAGDDALFGQNGGDTINGGDGNDRIDGGGSADTLRGDAGNDIIIGGGGSDHIWGGAGDDTINAGGTGDRDTIWFGSVTGATDIVSNGSDVITNFDADATGGQDRINLDALFDSLGVANASRASRVSIAGGNEVRVDMDGNGTFEYLIATVTTSAGTLDATDLVLS